MSLQQRQQRQQRSSSMAVPNVPRTPAPTPCEPPDDCDDSENTLSNRMLNMLPPTVVAVVNNNQGLALIGLAQFFFASMSLSVKFLMESEFRHLTSELVGILTHSSQLPKCPLLHSSSSAWASPEHVHGSLSWCSGTRTRCLVRLACGGCCAGADSVVSAVSSAHTRYVCSA
jgi:hypothetical protein